MWTFAAGALIAGTLLTVVGTLAPAAPSPPMAAPALASADGAGPVVGPLSSDPPPAPESSRAQAFQARLAASAPLEATIWRAFHPVTALVARRTAPRALRVAAGRTPQACLAQAVYYEARGEPRAGQAAVAQVVLNRSRSGAHPASVCGVVFEGAARSGCQFSFACDGRLGRSHVDAVAWRQAESVAADALSGREVPSLQTALNYHAGYVRPRWAAQLHRTAEIGRHIFYTAWSPVSHTLDALAPAPPPSAPAAAE